MTELRDLLDWPSWAWHERADGALVEPSLDDDALVHGWLQVWSRQGMTICDYACPTRDRARVAHQLGFVLANEFVTWSGPNAGSTYVSSRRLGERLHTSRKIIAAVLRDLAEVGVIEQVNNGRGKASWTWLAVPTVPVWRTRPANPHHAATQAREESGKFVKVEEEVDPSHGPGSGSVEPTHSDVSEPTEAGPCDGPGSGSVNGDEVDPSTEGSGSVRRTPTEVVTEVHTDVETHVSADRRVEVRMNDGTIVPVAVTTADQLIADGEAELVERKAAS